MIGLSPSASLSPLHPPGLSVCLQMAGLPSFAQLSSHGIFLNAVSSSCMAMPEGVSWQAPPPTLGLGCL